MHRLGIKLATAALAVLVTAATAWAFYAIPGSGSGTGGAIGTLTSPAITVPSTSSGSHTVTFAQQAALSDSTFDSQIEYTVQRKVDAGSFADISSGGCSGALAHGTTSCTDTIDASGGYTYRVIARYKGWTAASADAGPVGVTVGGGDDPAPVVEHITRLDASPSNAASVDFEVKFSEAVTGVDATDFKLATTGGVTGASVDDVTGADDTYTVSVRTGSGDGTLGLNLDDDDSIQDASSQALVGASDPDGDFTGESYAIDKTVPTVTSINRASTSPTDAGSVSWNVTFSEDVAGVDASDFALTQTGVSGASISDVSGGNATYTVTAGTGSGDGTLGLNLVDDDSITDAPGNKLGGTGAGNGNLAGQTYAIDKTAPTVESITRGTPTAAKTNAGSVTWDVTFSESVAGVNDTDFSLVASGLGGSPIVTGVSGGGSSYTVTASTGSGDGTLRLDLVDDDSIVGTAGDKLGGTGAGNGNFTGQQYTIDRTRPSVTAIQSFQSNGTTLGDGKFEANDYLKITFDEDMTGVAATNVDVALTRANGQTAKLRVEGITESSDAGSGAYFSNASGARSISSSNGVISLESSGGLTNNVVVIRIGTISGGASPVQASSGTLALVFDGGIKDPAGNVPGNFSTASTFKLF